MQQLHMWISEGDLLLIWNRNGLLCFAAVWASFMYECYSSFYIIQYSAAEIIPLFEFNLNGQSQKATDC